MYKLFTCLNYIKFNTRDREQSMHKPFLFPVKSPTFLSIVNYHCCGNRDLRSLLQRLIRHREIQAISTYYVSQLNSKINLGKTLLMQNEEAAEGMSLYERAVYRLNCLQSNAATLAKLQQNRRLLLESNIQETRECLHKLNISMDDIDKLNIVHITGTKGKGSTAAFLEAILRQLGYKTGFYSSPHLVHVCERIRINGRPISEQSFAQHFFHVYDTLNAARQPGQHMPAYFKFLTLMAFRLFCDEQVDVAIVEVGIGGEHDCTNVIRSPLACAITTLDLDHTKLLGHSIPEIAWHKAGIAKQGSTMLCVEQPADAMEVIAKRCQERKCQLFVVPTTLDAYGWPNNKQGIKLGIPGIQQHTNASLALQLARLWLHKMQKINTIVPPMNGCHESEQNGFFSEANVKPHQLGGFSVPLPIAEALEHCRWPGRSQILRHGKILYHLDGAHTPQSTQFCAQWFQETSIGQTPNNDNVFRVLLFHCTGDRDSAQLLPKFKDCHFQIALFCPTRLHSQPPPLSQDNTNLNIDTESDLRRSERDRDVWTELIGNNGEANTPNAFASPSISEAIEHIEKLAFPFGGAKDDIEKIIQRQRLHKISFPSRLSKAEANTPSAFAFPSISEAIEHIEKMTQNNPTAAQVHVLVTGSFHLVGGALAILDPDCTTI